MPSFGVRYHPRFRFRGRTRLAQSLLTLKQIALPAHSRWVFSFVGHLYSSVGIPCSRNVSGPVNRRPLDNNQKPLDTPESKVGETDCD